MTGYPEALKAHLATGSTTICRCFAVERKDGVTLGFTDHDRDLGFEGIIFRADSGLTAKALQQATGLSVDNAEAFGALRSDAISEADILAGRYDGAKVRVWLVNWAEVAQRVMQFQGRLGDLTRAAGGFSAELRGLSEQLNLPLGHIFHSRCSAVLGDTRCGFDLAGPGYGETRDAESVDAAQVFRFASFPGYDDRWFEKGRLEVLAGPAQGLVGMIKNDRATASGGRTVELWQALGAAPGAGDTLRLVAGCDKRHETCRLKFNNFINFRGFPDIPGEDWLMSYPVTSARNDGGSRRR